MTEQNLDELLEKHNACKNIIWKQWYEGNNLNSDGYDQTKKEFKKIMQKVENVIISNRDTNTLFD